MTMGNMDAALSPLTSISIVKMSSGVTTTADLRNIDVSGSPSLPECSGVWSSGTGRKLRGSHADFPLRLFRSSLLSSSSSLGSGAHVGASAGWNMGSPSFSSSASSSSDVNHSLGGGDMPTVRKKRHGTPRTPPPPRWSSTLTTWSIRGRSATPTTRTSSCS